MHLAEEDVECVDVSTAVSVLQMYLPGAFYFMLVPNLRRKKDKGTGKRLGTGSVYAEVARNLRQKGFMVPRTQDLKEVWTRFQSMRSSFTSSLREELVRQIKWDRMAAEGVVGKTNAGSGPSDRILEKVATLRWPTLTPASQPQDDAPEAGNEALRDHGDDEEKAAMYEKRNGPTPKNRRKNEVVGSSFKVALSWKPAGFHESAAAARRTASAPRKPR